MHQGTLAAEVLNRFLEGAVRGGAFVGSYTPVSTSGSLRLGGYMEHDADGVLRVLTGNS